MWWQGSQLGNSDNWALIWDTDAAIRSFLKWSKARKSNFLGDTMNDMGHYAAHDDDHWPVMVTILCPRSVTPSLDPRSVTDASSAPLTAATPTVSAGGGVTAPRAGPGAHCHWGANRVMTWGLEIRGQRVRQVWNGNKNKTCLAVLVCLRYHFVYAHACTTRLLLK